jgi:hypothetical protein
MLASVAVRTAAEMQTVQERRTATVRYVPTSLCMLSSLANANAAQMPYTRAQSAAHIDTGDIAGRAVGHTMPLVVYRML